MLAERVTKLEPQNVSLWQAECLPHLEGVHVCFVLKKYCGTLVALPLLRHLEMQEKEKKYIGKRASFNHKLSPYLSMVVYPPGIIMQSQDEIVAILAEIKQLPELNVRILIIGTGDREAKAELFHCGAFTQGKDEPVTTGPFNIRDDA